MSTITTEQATTADRATTTDSAAAAAPTLVQLDPASLLVDVNARTSPDLTDEFVASIAELGVLVPIVAVRTAEGAVRVRFGHRRSLAAIRAGRALVPVVIIGDEHDGADAGEALRIVQQYHENEHRAGLGVSDRVGAVAQLAAFGVAAGDIAARLGSPKDSVQQALAVAGSKLAGKAAARYDLTLDQAATVAEFEGKDETVKALIAAARQSPGVFAHAAQRARDGRAAEQAKAKVAADLATAGVRVIQTAERDPKVKYLSELVADAAGKKITATGHKKCPGHAAVIDHDWPSGDYKAAYVCTDWRSNGHRDRYAPSGGSVPAAAKTDAERDRESVQRREVIDNNKAWASAEAVRRAWLTQFLARKTAPKGASQFVAAELAHAGNPLSQALGYDGDAMLRKLLGVKDKTALATMTAKATDSRAQVLTLGFILAAYEASTGTQTWRHASTEMTRYFAYLAANGYELSEVERLTQPPVKRAKPPAAKSLADPEAA